MFSRTLAHENSKIEIRQLKIKGKKSRRKKKEMNVERSTVGTKKPRHPKRQKSLELVQSRQSLTTVRQEVRNTASDVLFFQKLTTD